MTSTDTNKRPPGILKMAIRQLASKICKYNPRRSSINKPAYHIVNTREIALDFCLLTTQAIRSEVLTLYMDFNCSSSRLHQEEYLKNTTKHQRHPQQNHVRHQEMAPIKQLVVGQTLQQILNKQQLIQQHYSPSLNNIVQILYIKHQNQMEYQIQEVNNNIVILCKNQTSNDTQIAIQPVIPRVLIQSHLFEELEQQSQSYIDQLNNLKQLVQLQSSQILCQTFKLTPNIQFSTSTIRSNINQQQVTQESSCSNLIDITALNESIQFPHQWIETNGFIRDSLIIDTDEFDIFPYNVAVHWLIDTRLAYMQYRDPVIVVFPVNMYIVQDNFAPLTFADYSQLNGYNHQYTYFELEHSIVKGIQVITLKQQLSVSSKQLRDSNNVCSQDLNIDYFQLLHQSVPQEVQQNNKQSNNKHFNNNSKVIDNLDTKDPQLYNNDPNSLDNLMIQMDSEESSSSNISIDQQSDYYYEDLY